MTLWLNGAPKSCLTTGFVNDKDVTHRPNNNTNRTWAIFGFKIKSYKFLSQHFKKSHQTEATKWRPQL